MKLPQRGLPLLPLRLKDLDPKPIEIPGTGRVLRVRILMELSRTRAQDSPYTFSGFFAKCT